MKIIAIFIAFNAAKTLEKFYSNFPKQLFDQIILVDDASSDQTFKISQKLGIKSYRNKQNLGYGGNMKRALKLALSLDADIIIDIHPDNEYKTTSIIPALKEIKKGSQFVLGNRFYRPSQVLESGMFFWKFMPIVFLNWLDRVILGVKISDFHQGFRVYTKNMLKQLNFEANSDNYLFSFELICQAVNRKIKISEVPIDTNYSGKKRGASFKNSLRYSVGTFKVLFFFILAQLGIKTEIFRLPYKKNN